MIRLAGLLAFLLLAACSDSEGATCSIAPNGDGTSTISCPGFDPVVIVGGGAGATCAIGPTDEGGRIIQCSDGTVVIIDANGQVIEPGSGTLEGTVQAFGLENQDVITISIESLGVSVRAGADGGFILGPVRAGTYEVRFEAPGFVPAIRNNVTIINGATSVDAVMLHRGAKLGNASLSEMRISPTRDALLVAESTDDPFGVTVLLWREGHSEAKRIGTYVARHVGYEFSPGGDQFFLLELVGMDGRLLIGDTETGDIVASVARRTTAAAWEPSGEAIYYKADSEEGCGLYRHEFASGESERIGTCTRFHPLHFSPSGRWLVFFDDAGRTQLYDAVEGRVETLAEAPGIQSVRFVGAGTQLLYFSDAGLWMLHSPEDGTTIELGETEPVVGPDGRSLVFQSAGQTVLFDVEERTRLVIGGGFPSGGILFSPAGSKLAWVESNVVVRVIDLAAPERLLEFPLGQRPLFASEDRLLIQEDSRALFVWDLRTDERLATHVFASTGQPLIVPGGEWAALVDLGGVLQTIDLRRGQSQPATDRTAGLPIAFAPGYIAWVEQAPEGHSELYAKDLASSKRLRIERGHFSSLHATETGGLLFHYEAVPGARQVVMHLNAGENEATIFDGPASLLERPRGDLAFYHLTVGEDSAVHVARIP